MKIISFKRDKNVQNYIPEFREINAPNIELREMNQRNKLQIIVIFVIYLVSIYKIVYI